MEACATCNQDIFSRLIGMPESGHCRALLMMPDCPSGGGAVKVPGVVFTELHGAWENPVALNIVRQALEILPMIIGAALHFRDHLPDPAPGTGTGLFLFQLVRS